MQDYSQEAPSVIKEYLGYMRTVKGKSPLTAFEYYTDLRTFFRYMKVKRKLVDSNMDFKQIKIDDIDINLIKTITLMDIFEYMNYLVEKRNNSSATRFRKAASLRSFFKYLTNKTNQLSYNPLQELELPKVKSSLPKFLTLEQSIELLKSVDGPYKERDYCILVLFLNCGMRLSELVGINLNDISSNNTIKITGKGNKERIVYLNDACTGAIENYLKVRPKEKLDAGSRNALFISRNHKRISPKTVQHIVKKYLSYIGLENQGYSTHKLRHTAATLMYQYGEVDIRILKDILGHEDLGTTQIYTHVSDKQMREAATSNPLSKIDMSKNFNKTPPV